MIHYGATKTIQLFVSRGLAELTKGKNVTAFKVGDPVFGMVNFPGHGKADAEYVKGKLSFFGKTALKVFQLYSN